MYYTKSDFDTEYKKGSVDRRRVEEEVEAVYIENLRHACYQEQINSKTLFVVSEMIFFRTASCFFAFFVCLKKS